MCRLSDLGYSGGEVPQRWGGAPVRGLIHCCVEEEDLALWPRPPVGDKTRRGGGVYACMCRWRSST